MSALLPSFTCFRAQANEYWTGLWAALSLSVSPANVPPDRECMRWTNRIKSAAMEKKRDFTPSAKGL